MFKMLHPGKPRYPRLKHRTSFRPTDLLKTLIDQGIAEGHRADKVDKFFLTGWLDGDALVQKQLGQNRGADGVLIHRSRCDGPFLIAQRQKHDLFV